MRYFLPLPWQSFLLRHNTTQHYQSTLSRNVVKSRNRFCLLCLFSCSRCLGSLAFRVFFLFFCREKCSFAITRHALDALFLRFSFHRTYLDREKCLQFVYLSCFFCSRSVFVVVYFRVGFFCRCRVRVNGIGRDNVCMPRQIIIDTSMPESPVFPGSFSNCQMMNFLI